MLTNDVIDGLLARRSVRSYQPDLISDEELDSLLTAARYAPSAMGRQERHFTVVTNKTLLKEIGDSYSLMTEAYDLLGEKKILETGYKDADLKVAVEAKKTSNLERSAGVVAAVHNKFKEGQWYSRTEINTGLQEIYRLFKIQYNKRGISGNICIYYVAKQSERKKKRGYLLKSKITAL